MYGRHAKENGIKQTGEQNFICNNCRKQFDYLYQYNGANVATKALLCSWVLNNSGVRDFAGH